MKQVQVRIEQIGSQYFVDFCIDSLGIAWKNHSVWPSAEEAESVKRAITLRGYA